MDGALAYRKPAEQFRSVQHRMPRALSSSSSASSRPRSQSVSSVSIFARPDSRSKSSERIAWRSSSASSRMTSSTRRSVSLEGSGSAGVGDWTTRQQDPAPSGQAPLPRSRSWFHKDNSPGSRLGNNSSAASRRWVRVP